VKERAALIVAVLVLFGGLTIWAAVAGRNSPDEALLGTLPAAPPIGEPVRSDDEAAEPVRRVLAEARMGGVPLVRLARRSGHPIHGIVVAGREALAAWERLRAAALPSHWPVVVGDGWAVRAHAGAIATTGDSPQAIAARARSFDVEAWLRSRLEASGAREGGWPEDVRAPTAARYAIVRDRRFGLPLSEVAIAILPTGDPANAPAWLAFGNWRGCPEPAVHVAVLARWRKRWDAEVVSIGEDAIELWIGRPPADRESAIAVAREHVAYAPALLEGGTRTIAELAAERVGARVWAFRWPRTRPIH
jgi:hypothetical protein